MIDGPALRRRLDEVLRTDADLDAFCLDSFAEVHRRFSGQMERTAKINLLLQLVPERDEVLNRLERYAAALSSGVVGVPDAGKAGEPRPAEAGSAEAARSTPQTAAALNWRDPFAILKAAITAVPVMKYALAVAGLAAAVAIATRGFGLDPATATVGALIVIGLMAVLIVLAVAARQSMRLVLPAMALTWAVLVLLVSSSVLLLGSFFFSWPKSTPCLFQPAQCAPDLDRTLRHSVEGK